MYRLTQDEQETIIRYDRASDKASIYTADPVVMRRLDDLASKTSAVVEVRADDYGRWYECPKSMVKVQKPRQVTEETCQRLKAMARSKQRAAGGD